MSPEPDIGGITHLNNCGLGSFIAGYPQKLPDGTFLSIFPSFLVVSSKCNVLLPAFAEDRREK
jgi:hypothetical protein